MGLEGEASAGGRRSRDLLVVSTPPSRLVVEREAEDGQLRPHDGESEVGPDRRERPLHEPTEVARRAPGHDPAGRDGRIRFGISAWMWTSGVPTRIAGRPTRNMHRIADLDANGGIIRRSGCRWEAVLGEGRGRTRSDIAGASGRRARPDVPL